MIKNMPKKIISEQQVIDAAKSLTENGVSPTLAAVRERLGRRGSQSTIHKYLKRWKQDCFNQTTMEGDPGERVDRLLEEKRILEQVLNQQKSHSEQYARELMNTEKAVLKLKEQNQQLTLDNSNLQTELKEVTALKNTFELLCQEIQAERGIIFEKLTGEKDRLIDELREEIKVINQQAITEVRNVSYDGHEALMQEKVKMINLQEKVIRLTEQSKQLAIELEKMKALNTQALKELEANKKTAQEYQPLKSIAQQAAEEISQELTNGEVW